MDLKQLLDSIWGLKVTEVKPIEKGLINHTWLVRTPTHNYILQRINQGVFHNPILLQDQLHVLSKNIALPHLVKLEFIEVEGQTCFEFEQYYFRLQRAITPSTTIHSIDEDVARLAAGALLEFHAALQKVSIENWKEPINNFLIPSFRIQAYQEAIKKANQSQLEIAKQAIEAINEQMLFIEAWQDLLDDEPKEFIHADPKLSNFLFTTNGKGVRSLIDWDTIQLGCPFYDYADMIRSFCSVGEEVSSKEALFRASIFEALVATFGVDENKLFTAAQGLVLVQALRFLTDFLEGNKYYKVSDELHNLRRAANQLRFVEEMQAYWTTTRRPAQ